MPFLNDSSVRRSCNTIYIYYYTGKKQLYYNRNRKNINYEIITIEKNKKYYYNKSSTSVDNDIILRLAAEWGTPYDNNVYYECDGRRLLADG